MPSLRGGICRFIDLILFLQFSFAVIFRHGVSRPQKDISLSSCQYNQIFLALQPKTDPRLAPSLVFPGLDNHLFDMFDHRFWPTNTSASFYHGQPILFIGTFRDQMPEGRLLSLRKGVFLQSQPRASKTWYTVDKIFLEISINSFQIRIPMAMIGLK